MSNLNREIVDAEVDGVDTRDYPDFCDAYLSYARWADTGEELTTDELMEYTEKHSDHVYELVINRIF